MIFESRESNVKITIRRTFAVGKVIRIFTIFCNIARSRINEITQYWLLVRGHKSSVGLIKVLVFNCEINWCKGVKRSPIKLKYIIYSNLPSG